MTALELYSEPFNPTGNVASEGIQNTLGRPTMDLLTMLVRETVQNSWDARRDPTGGVTYGLAGWALDEEARRVARGEVFRQEPPNLPIHEILSSNPMVLAVYDRGTTGLGGPIRADQLSEEARDFVDFLRNVGQPPDKEFGGGTFGYGKSSLYMASRVRTILVHTRCTYAGAEESRLMGAALGPQFQAGGHPFTGRHWWGGFANDRVIDPIVGESADAIASALGMPEYTEGETGTTILVIAPRLEDREPLDAMRFMGEGLLWNFWPKMIGRADGPPAMEFRLRWEGEPLDLPDPAHHAPLSGFVPALRAARESTPGESSPTMEVGEIRSQRPNRRLGMLALNRFPWLERSNKTDSSGPDALSGGAAIEGPAHHVALMRQAELVVRYLVGPELPTAAIEYGGVFITDPETDDSFAKAEPPTHDDWVPTVLENRAERRNVNVALREIRNALVDFATPRSGGSAEGSQVPLGAFAEGLGGLMPAEEGVGASVVPPPAGGPRGGGGNSRELRSGSGGDGSGGSSGSGAEGRATRPGLEIVEEPHLEEVDDSAAVVASFRVTGSSRSEEAIVSARAAVAVADGDSLERDAPAGGYVPMVLWWRNSDGDLIRGEPTIAVPVNDDGIWSVAVDTDPDTTLVLRLSIQAE